MNSFWITILSSAGIASLISAVALYITNMRVHKQKYKDDYYKMVIAKRMDAYAKVELLCKLLKTTTSCNDTNRQYCIAFEDMDSLLTLCKALYAALSDNVWLSQDLHIELHELNDMVIKIEDGCRKKSYSVKNIGIELYDDIKTRRVKIEMLYINDLLDLHEVKSFLKKKKASK